MCQVFAHTDPILYESRSRSVRIRGVITSVRLEILFWETLATMAHAEHITTNQLITQLHDEVHAFRGDFTNFASFLRVTCLRFQVMATESVIDDVNKFSPKAQNVADSNSTPANLFYKAAGKDENTGAELLNLRRKNLTH